MPHRSGRKEEINKKNSAGDRVVGVAAVVPLDGQSVAASNGVIRVIDTVLLPRPGE
ncbi:MAG: hypothetical protein OXB92_10375 [Acidimicrobiaceae bacterium]|nr:hypothetical protein [Acidimicrobiia bacterium]MCY4494249.1 hypothetical protein [Acidimicrobiaceae bacterium]